MLLSQTIRWGLVLVLGLGFSSPQSECADVPDESSESTQTPPRSGRNPADLSLEEPTTVPEDTLLGASKHAQKTTRALAATGIGTRDDIQQHGHRQLPWGLRGPACCTFANAKDEDTGARWEHSPQHPGKLNLSALLWRERVLVSPGLQATSERRTTAGNETNARAIVNLPLFSRKLVKEREFSASSYNPFVQRYSHPFPADFWYPESAPLGLIALDAVEQDGCSSRVKLRYRF